MYRRLSVLSLFLLAAAASSAPAATIVSVTASPTNVTAGTAITTAGWTQSSSYSNVSVSAVLSNASGSGASLAMHAFLTNSAGPGTTVANEIASVAFNLAPGIFQNRSLFTGLTLGPGSYFLVMQMDGGTTPAGGWSVAVPTIVTDTGVTRAADRFSSTAAGYAPASVLSPINNAQQLLYSVQSVDSSVPEPSTAAVVFVGLGLLIRANSRRAKRTI